MREPGGKVAGRRRIHSVTAKWRSGSVWLSDAERACGTVASTCSQNKTMAER
jgi:hypothetical protein